MARRKKDKIIKDITIHGIATDGKSVGRSENEVIFVKEAVPGDVVDVRITRKKKTFSEGVPVHYHEYSSKRVEPFCDHFGTCGGCKWQHLDYQAQLEYKQQQVSDSLSRIGHIDVKHMQPILPSAKKTGYRNKLEFTFSNKRWLTKEEIDTEVALERNALGFHIPGLFDKIVDVETCHLMEEPINEIKNKIRAYALEHNLDFFDIREQVGLLRILMVRQTEFGELMVLLQFFKEDKEAIDGLLEELKISFPAITSLLYVINPKKNDTFNDLEVQLFSGKDHIVESMGDLRFRIGPKSFYQTNSIQAEALYKVVVDFAGFTGEELVYDLYTGTGTIANYCASMAKKVIGIEYVPEAIEDAFVNSEINEIKNTDFYAGDMKDLLNASFIEKHGAPDTIITDPPRAGMHTDVVDVLLATSPKKIVYVSCNPATQARDIALMSEKYEVTKIQPVDMFPHTHHVECVVLLELKG